MFSRRSLAVASTITLCAGLLACGHKDAGPPARYAFVTFENLSGDSSLDWVTRGASEYLARSLHNAFAGSTALSADAIARADRALGRPATNVPGDSAQRAAAILAGANHVITGYIERTPGGIRIAAADENLITQTTERTLSATAPSAFDALNQLAHRFSDRAAAPPSSNAEAFRYFSTALENPVANAAPLLERAVAADPDFGRAWVALTRTEVMSGDRLHAEDAIARAHRQKLAPIDRAFLDFDDAALQGDKTATLTAMKKVFDFDSSDRLLARTIATDETTAGDFTSAAAFWKRLTSSDPNDADAWNQLGYTLGWAGDYSGASAAIREYARIRPSDANPLDSLGDIEYWFGKYSNAAANYAAADIKSPAFLTGGDLYKEAWAKFRAGDKTGADAAFAKFKDARTKAKELTFPLIEGDWLYRTGRATEGIDLLRGSLKDSSAPPQVRSASAEQLGVFDLLAADRAAAVRDLTATGTTSLTPGALLVRFAAQPSASVSEWEARSSAVFARPELAGLRLTALGYALILDGKKQDAIPVWEQIVKQSPGNDFFSRDILARLKGQPIAHPIVPDPAAVDPFHALLDKL